jgi:hypothetical protein
MSVHSRILQDAVVGFLVLPLPGATSLERDCIGGDGMSAAVASL